MHIKAGWLGTPHTLCCPPSGDANGVRIPRAAHYTLSSINQSSDGRVQEREKFYEQLLKLQVDIDRAKLNSMNMHPLMREEMNKCLEIIRKDEESNTKKKKKQKKPRF
jgi:hypothetical protein